MSYPKTRQDRLNPIACVKTRRSRKSLNVCPKISSFDKVDSFAAIHIARFSISTNTGLIN